MNPSTEDAIGNRVRTIAFILSQLLEMMNPKFRWDYALGVQFETKAASIVRMSFYGFITLTQISHILP